MKTQRKQSLFLFRRDLRLEDNSALNRAVADSQQVIPCFIRDPRREEPQSTLSRQFLLESLAELDSTLKNEGSHLYYADGSAVDIIHRITKEVQVDAVYMNAEFTPEFRRLREELEEFVPTAVFHDRELFRPEDHLKKDGTPYKVFTPFLRFVKTKEADPPAARTTGPGVWSSSPISVTEDLPEPPLPKRSEVSSALDSMFARGGRSRGLQALEGLEHFQNYPEIRDFPALRTSGLAPHLAHGTISIREAFFKAVEVLGFHAVFVDELIWRDFWFYIAWHFPRVFTGNFHEKFDSLHWVNDETAFAAWCRGETGFPIIDAGMRELVATGFMHNRVRMAVASFLTKDLHIDWRWGERFFAEHLLDYDPCVNNGNWQWAASTGCDAQPYFRIFNPWSQQKRFDPNAEYIKKWIPELSQASPREILKHQTAAVPGYQTPIVDHSTERKVTLELYKAV